jgi:feruloyl-CoA synthase
VHWASERVGLIGLPFPGVQLKMVPTGEDGRYELRLKSVIVTPGYYKQPELTAEMFDEEGFYKIGDAGRFVDPDDPSWGLVFDGRVVEGLQAFKRHLRAGRHLAYDRHRGSFAGAAGRRGVRQDRDYVGLLGFPMSRACRRVAGDEHVQLSTHEVLAHPA